MCASRVMTALARLPVGERGDFPSAQRPRGGSITRAAPIQLPCVWAHRPEFELYLLRLELCGVR